jgi:hypothetical protein
LTESIPRDSGCSDQGFLTFSFSLIGRYFIQQRFEDVDATAHANKRRNEKALQTTRPTPKIGSATQDQKKNTEKFLMS